MWYKLILMHIEIYLSFIIFQKVIIEVLLEMFFR